MRFKHFIEEMAKYDAFHGSPINNITVFKIGNKGKDEKGPGIYFTSSERDAKHYSAERGKIYKVIIDIKKPIPLKGKTKEDIIIKLARDSLNINTGSFQEQLEKLNDDTWLSNWGNNRSQSFYNGVNAIIDRYPNEPYEAYLQCWADFYNLDNERYLKKISNWYDGVIFKPKEDNIIGEQIVHYIVFKPEQVKILK